MALKDILEKLAADAAAEAEAILAEARGEAAAITARAEAQAAEAGEEIRRRMARATEGEVETVRAQARLAGRDAELATRRALLAEAQTALEERIGTLPAAGLASLLATRVLGEARAGERIEIGSGFGSEVRSALADALVAAGVAREALGEGDFSDAAVRVRGDRMGAEISVASLIASNADVIEETLMNSLFAEGAD